MYPYDQRFQASPAAGFPAVSEMAAVAPGVSPELRDRLVDFVAAATIGLTGLALAKVLELGATTTLLLSTALQTFAQPLLAALLLELPHF
jgi:hypothetical protein